MIPSEGHVANYEHSYQLRKYHWYTGNNQLGNVMIFFCKIRRSLRDSWWIFQCYSFFKLKQMFIVQFTDSLAPLKKWTFTYFIQYLVPHA